MPEPWTLERLNGLSHKQLNTLFEHALSSSDPAAAQVLDIIEENKMMERLGGGFRKSHRLIVDMEKLCRSQAGVAAAVAAAELGEAPMAGVDPLLVEHLGADYGQRDSTSWAGTFVGEEMWAAGWRKHGRKALPAGCVAKTAAFFIRLDTNA